MLLALPPALTEAAAALLQACRARAWRLAVAESCTGGLVAAALTAVPGSSEVLERGFVTYSDEAKAELLGVPAAAIAAEGAVSEAVAVAMAEGALARSRADLALSVTGVAGPGGGSERKPVGLVWLGVAREGWAGARRFRFPGDRDAVRGQAAMAGMEMLLAHCGA